MKQDGVEEDVVIKENVEIEGDIEQDSAHAKESEQSDAESNTLIADVTPSSPQPTIRVSARSNKGVAGERYKDYFSFQ